MVAGLTRSAEKPQGQAHGKVLRICCDRLSSPKGDVATRKEGGLGGLTDVVVRWPQWQGRGHGEAAGHCQALRGDWSALVGAEEHSCPQYSVSALGGSLAPAVREGH